jgi:hypothetical protein
VRVAAAANGDVKRWARSSGIRQRLAKSDIVDEPLRCVNVINAELRIASPHAIAMQLDLLRQHAADSTKVIDPSGQTALIGQHQTFFKFLRSACKSLTHNEVCNSA